MVENNLDNFNDDEDVPVVVPAPKVPEVVKPKETSLEDKVNEILKNGGEVVLENVTAKEFNEAYAKFIKNIRAKELMLNISLDGTKVSVKNLKDA